MGKRHHGQSLVFQNSHSHPLRIAEGLGSYRRCRVPVGNYSASVGGMDRGCYVITGLYDVNETLITGPNDDFPLVLCRHTPRRMRNMLNRFYNIRRS